ncbi:MAG: hypothetical protein ACYC7E_14520 [Armatimonadota bacterium]
MKTQAPKLLSTHPTSTARMARLEQITDTAGKYPPLLLSVPWENVRKASGETVGQ